MIFNEDSKVKIPSIIHLIRLGYNYLSLSEQTWDESTNIFTDLFKKSIKHLNPELDGDAISRLYAEVSLCLENEDLGKAFYERLPGRTDEACPHGEVRSGRFARLPQDMATCVQKIVQD